MSTFDERWDKRRKQQPPLPWVPGSTTPPPAVSYNPSTRVADEVAGSYRLANGLRLSAVITLVLGLLGAFIIWSDSGVGTGIIAAASIGFAFLVIRWLEQVLVLLTGMSLKLHGLDQSR